MGKHAQPRQPSRARRAAVVSGGTLLLCLGTAAPALADIGPVPVPQPIDDTVDQLSDATGLPNPIETADDVAGDSTDQTTTTKHSKHKHHSTRLSTTTLKAEQTNTTQRHPAKRQQPAAVTPASYTYGGLRGVPMTTSAPLVEAGRAPVTAGAVSGDTAVLAAGSAPTLVKPSADLLDGAGGQEGPRVLLIGLAAMVVGGLSAGHIKVAQDRLAQIIGG
jgi:hypothetical protein